ncbi:MAG: hypothetical protein KKD39_02785 [Candidatus Altiarchaeota archaeon]|nr:hypothetical protein [Candidatus Altiarchaeota archaeon]
MNDLCGIELKDFEVTSGNKNISFEKDLAGLCPALFHTVLPYIFSFQNGSWFSWEQDKDSVTAMCPMGYVGVEVRRKGKNQAVVRVTESGLGCPRHKLGQEYATKVTSKTILLFDQIFPYLMYVKNRRRQVEFFHDSYWKISLKKSKSSKAVGSCFLEGEVSKRLSSVEVTGMLRGCAYHRGKAKYDFDRVSPKGFCLFAYHLIYPPALSRLYSGVCDDEVRVRCPGTKNYIVMKIIRRPKPFRVLYVFLEWFFRRVNFCQDITFDRVFVEVSEVKGCPANVAEGFSFEFGVKGLLCPASFDNLFSQIVNSDREGVFQCPAAPCRIKFGLGLK